MRISELEVREPDFWLTTRTTLERGWTAQLNRPVRVSCEIRDTGQRWGVQRLLSAFFTGIPSNEVRTFLADQFRYTRVRSRAVLQYMLGSMLTWPVCLRLCPAAFLVEPAIEHGEDILIVPGNRRIRVFDFRVRKCRLFAKPLLGEVPNKTEAALRTRTVHPSIVPVLSHAADGAWLEEPLVAATALSRLPAWQSPRISTGAAFRALGDLLLLSAETLSARDYADETLGRIRERTDLLVNRCSTFPASAVMQIATVAAGLVAAAGSTSVASGHGDFQAGNILVRPHDEGVFLVDWEDSARRWLWYDFMVFALRARSPHGLKDRLRAFSPAFVLRHAPSGLARFSGELTGIGGVARFVLEELLWCIDDEIKLQLPMVSGRLTLMIDQLSGICGTAR